MTAGCAATPSLAFAVAFGPASAPKPNADQALSSRQHAERRQQIERAVHEHAQADSIQRRGEAVGPSFVENAAEPVLTLASGAPQTTTTQRMNEMADDFTRAPPLERGARDAHESAVLKGQDGWGMKVLLAVQRGRWDIATPAIAGRLSLVVVVLGGIWLLGKLFSRRKA